MAESCLEEWNELETEFVQLQVSYYSAIRSGTQ